MSLRPLKGRNRKCGFNHKATGCRTRERLRNRYRPDPVQILFVGESPPASGRFFYQADSGLYHAIREAFVIAIPPLKKTEFLNSFQSLGCYLVDLCYEPVDKMPHDTRRCAWSAGEVRLARTIRDLRPEVIVTLVRSIRVNVRRAWERAGWTGLHLELPYPGRWHSHRVRFRRELVPLLRKTLGKAPLPDLPNRISDASDRHKMTASRERLPITKNYCSADL
jgi:hypothetical protein